MHIEELLIENYRSVQHARMSGLGPFVVLYGGNGAGKSNVLAAIGSLAWLVRCIVSTGSGLVWGDRAELPWANAGPRLGPNDFCAQRPGGKIRLGVTLGDMNSELFKLSIGDTSNSQRGSIAVSRLRIEVEARIVGTDKVQTRGLRLGAFTSNEGAEIALSDLWMGGTAALDVLHSCGIDVMSQTASVAERWAAEARDRMNHVLNQLMSSLFGLIPAIRSLDHQAHAEESENNPGKKKRDTTEREQIAGFLAEGKLREALFRAKNSPDRGIRSGFEQLRRVLEGAPLNRPHFDPVVYPDGRLELQEDLPDGQASLPLTSAGLGVQQLYAILASVLLSGCATVGLEEPEAHLHGPTTGAALRRLLRKIVTDGQIQQIFVATHSNLFDLDVGGYWDVSLHPEHGTEVRREANLTRLHERHLWEPGPAMEALLDMLKVIPPDLAVFRAPTGRSVSASEMIKLLVDDDTLAFDYLKDVTAAAVRAVQIRAGKTSS